MVYLNRQKRIYADDIKGASSNQETFIYAHANEREQKQLEMQRESTEVLQQLQRDVFAKNQQLERIAKRLKEMDKNRKSHQQVQEKVLDRLDLLDENSKNESGQLAQVLAIQKKAETETGDIKNNQASIHVKLEKMEDINEIISKKVEEQGNKLEEIYNQTGQREEELTLLHERIDTQEAWLEKLMRQVHDLRGIIYERADEVIKKIEKSIQLFGGKWNVVHREDTKSSKETLKK
ncbi:hypothetical protein [Oceanobacillus neutriphilus]|uniref:Uncharacterized protein n=1 Tax=Oceanobacillus neutriphilus TaxID=531815 RepID=A0ABQ2NTR0_9BACI|nr:hypothetical protein [Oceanobacillus neutriphilus]GGP09925.1 hypothetical protein GCM10011346_15980 [Oceanobacillus neutriphilus]